MELVWLLFLNENEVIWSNYSSARFGCVTNATTPILLP